MRCSALTWGSPRISTGEIRTSLAVFSTFCAVADGLPASGLIGVEALPDILAARPALTLEQLAELIREFCNKPENNYEVYENYSGPAFLGEIATTLGIVVKSDRNFFDVLDQLARFLESKLEAKEIDYSVVEELEGANVSYTEADSPDSDAVIYFPLIKDFHPLQP